MSNRIEYNPSISVVFTSYNHREYLRQALDALINQTFKNFELIIVDDCSTDGSQEILKEYAVLDQRIRLYLNDKNSGSYVISTNYGASLATAPYVVFAQCDDWAERNQLELLYQQFCLYDIGVVFSSSYMVDSDGNVLGLDFEYRSKLFKKNCNSDCVIKDKDAFLYLLDSCIIPNLSAALIKKELFDELKGLSEDYVVLSDWDFWLKLSQKCDFYYIRQPLNNFRQHSTTIRNSVKIERQIDELFLMYRGVLLRSSDYRYRILTCAAKVCILIIIENLGLFKITLKKIWSEGRRLSYFWMMYMFIAFVQCCYSFLQSKLSKILHHI